MVVYGAVSATLNVGVTEKTGTATLTLTGPATVVEDIANTYTGVLTGLGGVAISGAWIDISYQPTGGAWTLLTTVTTDATGKYTVAVTFANPGNYVLKAYWSGGSISG